jgi:hypothetical protein
MIPIQSERFYSAFFLFNKKKNAQIAINALHLLNLCIIVPEIRESHKNNGYFYRFMIFLNPSRKFDLVCCHTWSTCCRQPAGPGVWRLDVGCQQPGQAGKVKNAP